MATNLALAGTVTAASEYSTYLKERGNDDNTALQWIATAANHWWRVDLGSEKAFDKISIMTGTVTYSFVVEGSHNDADWTTLVTASNAVRNTLVDFPLSPYETYRYVRIRYTDGANWSTLHEMQIWEAAVPVTVTVPVASLTLTPQQIQTFPILPPVSSLLLTSFVPLFRQGIQLGVPPGLIIMPLIPIPVISVSPAVKSLILTALAPAYTWAIPANQRPAAQIIFTCTLTGDGESPVLLDLDLPMASFQMRLKADGPNYLSVVIPNAADYEAEISARSNGQIVVKMGYRFQDGSESLEELARADFDTLRVDTGASSSSATLAGYDSATSYDSPKEWTIGDVSYRCLQENGLVRLRAKIDMFLRPGDTVIYGSDEFIVGEIIYYINPEYGYMEVVEEE